MSKYLNESMNITKENGIYFLNPNENSRDEKNKAQKIQRL